MKPIALLAAAAVLGLTSLPAIAQPRPPAHTFTIQGDQFLLDGKPFKVLSGELHYARIPREYWHARLKMARAMGLNTIATYVFWNVHEPSPGQYNFSGNADLVAFIKAAQEEGLYVILRAGPYSCAEWEFGGYPAWLLKDPRMSTALRTNNPAFMVPVERWITRLAKETAPLQVGRGGPILITQVENEYGSWVEHDSAPPDPNHTYMTHMRDIFVRAGFTDSLLDTVDGGEELALGGVPGVFTGVNFGVGDSKKQIPLLAAFQPNKPILVTEYWPGWFDYWGHPHQTRPLQPQLDDLDYILSHGNGINLYMFHGGTSFGFMSGANLIDGQISSPGHQLRLRRSPGRSRPPHSEIPRLPKDLRKIRHLCVVSFSDVSERSPVYVNKRSVINFTKRSIIDFTKRSIIDFTKRSIIDFSKRSVIDVNKRSVLDFSKRSVIPTGA